MHRLRRDGIMLTSLSDSYERPMTAHRIEDNHLGEIGVPERRRVLMWLMLSVLAALLAYFGFRAYLNPELLLHFANSLTC